MRGRRRLWMCWVESGCRGVHKVAIRRPGRNAMVVLDRDRSCQEVGAARKSGVENVHCRGCGGRKKHPPTQERYNLPTILGIDVLDLLRTIHRIYGPSLIKPSSLPLPGPCVRTPPPSHSLDAASPHRQRGVVCLLTKSVCRNGGGGLWGFCHAFQVIS